MQLTLDDTRHLLEDTAGRVNRHLNSGLRTSGDALARAAGQAASLAKDSGLTKSAWPRMAGFAALGFVVGAAVLGGRKAAMQATTGIAGDWFSVLKADHKLVDALFELLLKTEDSEVGKRTALFAKITYALAKHQFEEEHVIYPALRDGGPSETPKHLDAEHFDMKTYTHELSVLAKDDPRWIKKARALHKLIKDHVREEEEIVFPAFHQRLSKADNARLTKAMHREGIKLA